MNINDNFRISGSVMRDFDSVVNSIAADTKHESVKVSDITLLSLCRLPEFEHPEKKAFYVFTEDYIDEFLDGKKLRIGWVAKEAFSIDLWNQLESTTGLILVSGGEKYLISDNAIVSLMTRSSVSGGATASRNNVIRDLHIADALFHRGGKIGFVYRNDEDAKKIFAFTGGKYKMVPQTILTDIKNTLTKSTPVECKNWSIDHNYTDLSLVLPGICPELSEKISDAVSAGVILSTSDTGMCSITAKGVIYSKRGYVITDEISAEHTLGVSPSELVERVDKKIFSDIRKLSDTLIDLLGYSVSDESADLSDTTQAEKNKERVMNLISSLVKKFLKGILPVKKQKELIEEISVEINPDMLYTGYDIADLFIGLADRISGLERHLLDKVRKACAEIPYDIKKIAATLTSTTSEEDESITLVAS